MAAHAAAAAAHFDGDIPAAAHPLLAAPPPPGFGPIGWWNHVLTFMA
eukprot:gene16232-18787_t